MASYNKGGGGAILSISHESQSISREKKCSCEDTSSHQYTVKRNNKEATRLRDIASQSKSGQDHRGDRSSNEEKLGELGVKYCNIDWRMGGKGHWDEMNND
jgi:hypothetical protein